MIIIFFIILIIEIIIYIAINQIHKIIQYKKITNSLEKEIFKYNEEDKEIKEMKEIINKYKEK